MLGGSRLGIVIPAYNEEKSIGGVVRKVKSALPNATVIVVNDCSRDSTADCAQEAGAVVHTNEINLGYDATLGKGFEVASKLEVSKVITLDADGQHDAEDLSKFVEALGRCDLVLGVRPEKARLSEKIAGFYVNSRFSVKDILCGMKGYNISLWEKYDRKFSTFDSIGMELSFFALSQGVSFEQVDILIHEREGESRFGRVLRGNYLIIKAFLRLYWLFR